MSSYSASTTPTAIYPGDSSSVFVAEQPAVPQASRQVALCELPGGQPNKLSGEILFSGAPGVFQLDIQTADTDTDAAYKTIAVGGSITAVDANQRARAEFANVVARFARVILVSRANAVNITVNLTA